METKLCKLQYALGRVEACPESGCPFWEPGGAALEGRCAVEQIDFAARPDLAELLVRVRLELERVRTRREADEVRSLFYRLLDTADSDGG